MMPPTSAVPAFPPRPCPVCGATAPRPVYRQRFAGMSGAATMLRGYTVAVCGECGAGYADDIPGQDVFDAYYREMSKYEAAPVVVPGGGMAGKYRRAAAAVRPELASPAARVLDVGCATGDFLAALREQGCENLLGLDPSAACADFAWRQHGVRVVNQSLAEVTAAKPPFDLVTLTGVLEHIRDVAGVLGLIRASLAPGGLVFFTLPDATRFLTQPNAPFQDFSVEHINFFSPTSLTRLLAAAGFAPVFVRRETAALSETAVEPGIWGLFRKADAPPADRPFDAETGPALDQYVRHGTRIEAKVHAVLEALATDRRPVLVWGTGTHTLRLLELSPLGRVDVRAYIDGNPRYHGRDIGGVPIIAPADVRGRPEAILVSSWVHQPAIVRTIRDDMRLPNDVLTLYDT